MKPLAMVACWLWLCLPAVAAEPTWAPLFDGRSFSGWEGNLELFRIQDQAVVGGFTDRPVPRNEYLCSAKRYRDFELRLSFRVVGENVNAGIQFRSDRVRGRSEMVGYQADVGQKYWGCLYDERRHKLLAGPTKDEQQKIIRPDGWNDYVIRAEGRHVQLWLNGRQTVDYTEPDPSIPQEGVFGLQIHKGPASEAWYKNIQIRLLPAGRLGS